MGVPRHKTLLFLGCNTNMAASLLEKIYLWADSSLKLVVVGTRRPRHMMFRDLKYKNTPKVIPIEFDISNEDSYGSFIARVFDILKRNGIPQLSAIVLCCNRLFPRRSDPNGIVTTHMMQQFMAETVRPVLLIQTFLPYMLRSELSSILNVSNLNNENRDLTGHTSIGGYTFDGALNEAFEGQQANTIIINLTTMASSISETETLNYLSYQCAKCSQNMAIKALAKGLKDTGILLYSMAIDNGALYKKNKKVGFSSLVDVYEVTDSGEVEVTQYDISEDETSSRSEGDSREHKEGISLKSTVTGILTLLDNANPFLSGQLINGQGIPMKF